jgi:hypothetical protein
MNSWLRPSTSFFPRQIFLPCVLILTVSLSAFSHALRAQTTSASLSGTITDRSGALAPGVQVRVINLDTNVVSETKTNGAGVYNVPNLNPGRYRILVTKDGFKQIDLRDITLNVQDSVNRNFTIDVGGVSETVVVNAGDRININTTDASVSTVVDHNYIENMPLNGRSFQDLILLTPGVVTNSPQEASSVGATGEFSVNGQRTESNYYTVDGVSANVGAAPADIRSGVAGGVTAATALGTTQPLASIDSLQEFRVQSSTYSADYGRTPGGQFSYQTRSGTNQWHGTAFEYLRNDYFDANNWFNNYYGQPKSRLRQNDFGGVLGGPVRLPGVYNGKDKTFFFFSYEGLRLIEPQASTLSLVPDTALRQAVVGPLHQVLNSFSVPNGPDLGNGLAEFIGTWSNPSAINAYSIRLDHSFNAKLRTFFRFSDTPSKAASRLTSGSGGVPTTLQGLQFAFRTYTFGATSMISNRVDNEFRLNYSSSSSSLVQSIDNFGGAQAVDLAHLQGLNPASNAYFVTVGLSFGNDSSTLQQGVASTVQRQWNLTDSLSLSTGRHIMRFGIDYRRLASLLGAGGNQVGYFFFSANDVQTNNPAFVSAANTATLYPLYQNFAAFIQDEWRITSSLNISLGLRWEVNPAPGVTQGTLPYTVEGAGNLATMTLAPQGTPLWKTAWSNFAPRLGAAYSIRNAPGRETVLRGGAGLFFDTGQQLGSLGFGGPGFSSSQFFGYAAGSPVNFPIPSSDVPSIQVNPTPPYGPSVFSFPSHLQLPFTIEWNMALEQALGKSQTVSVSYVGSHAARLLEEHETYVAPFNPNFSGVLFLIQNGLTADYNALQTRFQRRMSKGLTALASYTWSHSIDYGSQNLDYVYARGNSDFDVRHTVSAAFSYDLPGIFHSRIARGLTQHWGIDQRFTARTGFPVSLNGNRVINPVTGQVSYQGLNLVPGQPVYLYGANCASVLQGLGDLAPGQQCPGDRAINPNAFNLAPSPEPGNAPRNFVRGFGAWQTDLAVRRNFPIHERLTLQFRAEAFNVFNHPNFGYVNPLLGQPTFGQATATLNTSLGTLNPLYQMGGPRSMQLALRLVF